MTACKEAQGATPGKKAVGATLAGVLAVGMVPAGAFAAEAPADGAQDDGIDLLEATDVSAAEDGAIVAFKKGAEAGASFTANGEAQGIEPSKVQPWGTTGEKAQLDVSGYTVMKVVGKNDTNAAETVDRTIDGKTFYYDNTATLYNELPTQIGDYAVFAKVKVNGAEVNVNAGATFSIKAADLQGAELYEVNAKDADDLSDTEFVFDNSNWTVNGTKLGIKIGDKALSAGDFDFQYYNAKEQAATPKAAGTYTVVATGKASTAYAGQKAKLALEVKPFDLSTANVTVSDTVKTATGVNQADLATLKVNDSAYVNSWVEDYTDVTFTNLPTTTGKATLTLTPNEAALKAAGVEGSVINSKAIDYAVVNQSVPVSATYGTQPFSGALNVDFSADPTNAFDASKVKVSYTDPKTGKQVDTDKYTLRVVNTKTNEVGGADMLAKPGNYTVTVILDAAGLNYEYCGSTVPSMSVNVTKGSIAVTDVAFAYKGKIATGTIAAGEYTPGKNAADDIAVTVKTANGTVDPSDYTVEITKEGKDGEYVAADAITDAGNYKMTVKAEGYTMDAGTEDSIAVTVGKRDLSKVQIKVVGTFDYTESTGTTTVAHKVLPYTGEVITPSYQWSVNDKTWYDLPADDYDAVYTQNGKKVEFKEAGVYKAELAAAKDSTNYANAVTTWPEISDKKVFADVPNNVWYTQSVYDAVTNEYMNGYAGTNLFGPNDSITRGQVACVLFNMAGGDAIEFAPVYDKNGGVVTGFDDVDGAQYYAGPIAWAKQAGVINGYGDGTFAPDAPVTREEFAAMLANYAETKGEAVSSTDADAVLAAMSDGNAVSGWAKQVVAWAVEKKIMGNGGFIAPSAQITRAEAAAMAVNYQPEKDDTILG